MVAYRQFPTKRRKPAIDTGPAPVDFALTEQEEQDVWIRVEEWSRDLRPRDEEERWLVEQMARESIRMDVCQRREMMLNGMASMRASISWDVDRMLEAEILGQDLPKKPALVVAQLRRTSHGCQWLIDRWLELLAALDAGVPWNVEQRSKALDLLGVDKALRSAPSLIDPAPHEDPIVAQREEASYQIEALRTHKSEVLDPIDERERKAAEQGQSFQVTTEHLQLSRFESACMRRLQWASEQLRRKQRGALKKPTFLKPKLELASPLEAEYPGDDDDFPPTFAALETEASRPASTEDPGPSLIDNASEVVTESKNAVPTSSSPTSTDHLGKIMAEFLKAEALEVLKDGVFPKTTTLTDALKEKILNSIPPIKPRRRRPRKS